MAGNGLGGDVLKVKGVLVVNTKCREEHSREYRGCLQTEGARVGCSEK